MRLTRFAAVLAPIAATAIVALPQAASAVTASETLTGGSLNFINSTPADITFPGVTLSGTANQTDTRTQLFDVDDARGNGAGWNVTATSTTFTDASSDTLPTTATTVQSAPSASCDASVTCTTATTTGLSFPYTLPAGISAPTATKLFNANTGTGLAAQSFSPSWQIAIPANSRAGTYTSTWTFSLTTGP